MGRNKRLKRSALCVWCLFGVLFVACASTGRQQQDASPALLQGLRSDEESKRGEAVDALIGMGEEALPTLIAALGDEKTSVREIAAYLIGSLGSKGAPAVPALKKALEDSDWSVRLNAERSLRIIDPDCPCKAKPRR
jgi:HEAT repeat protein